MIFFVQSMRKSCAQRVLSALCCALSTVAMERAAWSEPVAAGAISERGRQQAAEGAAEELLRLIRQRGCKEAFLPNAALLHEGKVCAPLSLRCPSRPFFSPSARLALGLHRPPCDMAGMHLS
jgi:hypothetical protein